MFKKSLFSACLIFSVLLQKAHAIDLQPGEVKAPRPNINLVQYSYILSERGNQYQHGEKQPTRTSIQSSLFVVRLAKSFQLGQMPAFFYLQTPMGTIQADGFPQLSGLRTDGDTGVGDTSLAFAVWPYSNHKTGTYFGVGAYLTMPTGDYDRHCSFNMGENRCRSALQAGFQTQITQQMSWMAALDGVFYQDNLTQLHRYQLSVQSNYDFGRLLLQYGIDLKN